MVAVERQSEGGMGANAFLSFKGQLTKCPLEHIRPASSLEQIAADSWEEAIREVIDSAADAAPKKFKENMAILLVLLMVRDYLAKRRLFMELYRFLQLYLTPSPVLLLCHLLKWSLRCSLRRICLRHLHRRGRHC